MERFVGDLEKVLGVKRINFNIEREWAVAALPQSDMPLKDYLATVGDFNSTSEVVGLILSAGTVNDTAL